AIGHPAEESRRPALAMLLERCREALQRTGPTLEDGLDDGERSGQRVAPASVTGHIEPRTTALERVAGRARVCPRRKDLPVGSLELREPVVCSPGCADAHEIGRSACIDRSVGRVVRIVLSAADVVTRLAVEI